MAPPAAPRLAEELLQWRAGEFPRLIGAARAGLATARLLLQWRAGEFPRLIVGFTENTSPMRLLQWRAGEFPRLIGLAHDDTFTVTVASMEGGGIPPPDYRSIETERFNLKLQWRAGEFPRLI